MGVIRTGVGQWQLSWNDELLSETRATRARAADREQSSRLVLRQFVAIVCMSWRGWAPSEPLLPWMR